LALEEGVQKSLEVAAEAAKIILEVDKERSSRSSCRCCMRERLNPSKDCITQCRILAMTLCKSKRDWKRIEGDPAVHEGETVAGGEREPEGGPEEGIEEGSD
jgi:hypothetical protein